MPVVSLSEVPLSATKPTNARTGKMISNPAPPSLGSVMPQVPAWRLSSKNLQHPSLRSPFGSTSMRDIRQPHQSPGRRCRLARRASAQRTQGRRSMDRFFSDENLSLYKLLASSTDVAQRRTILKLLANETAKMKSELRQTNSGGRCGANVGEARN